MSIRNVMFLCTLIALSPVAMPAAAQVNINIDIGVAPPPPRYEAVPARRPGYVWAPGYWNWEDQRHAWTPGRWLLERRGSTWVADRWDARDGRHQYEPGHWKQNSKQKKTKHEDKGNGKGWAKGRD